MGYKQSYFLKKYMVIFFIFMLIFTPVFSLGSHDVSAEEDEPKEEDVIMSDDVQEVDETSDEDSDSSDSIKSDGDASESDGSEEEKSDEGDLVESLIDEEDIGEPKATEEAPKDKGSVTGKITSIDRDGCSVSITTELGAGDYILKVWDDGVLIHESLHTMAKPGEHVFTWEIESAAMEGMPGVGIVLYSENDGKELDYKDPYEYPREVASACADPTPEPDPDPEPELQEVTPVQPKVTQATCDVNGVTTNPSIDLPVNEGVKYEIDGDIKAGETVTIIAAPFDDSYELVIPSEWTLQEGGLATLDITLDKVNCEDETPVVEKIISIDRDGCIVFITTELGIGDYTLEVWDDGVLIDEIPHLMTEPGEHVFTWEIAKAAMENAPGVAFVIKDENDQVKDTLDPYEYPREVAQMCGRAEQDEKIETAKASPDKVTTDIDVEETVVEVKDEIVEETDGETLPNTATSMFNILLAGSVLFMFGGITLFIFRKRKV